MTNEIKITGTICNIKELQSASGGIATAFGLNIYTGKDKEGNATYGFINGKVFNRINFQAKTVVDIVGWLSVDKWTSKEGKEINSPVLCVREIKEYVKGNNQQNNTKNGDKSVESEPLTNSYEGLEDSLPF